MSIPQVSIRKLSGRQIPGVRKSKSKSVDNGYTVQDLPSLRRKRTIAYKRLTKAFELGTVAFSEMEQRELFFSYYQEMKQIVSNFEDAHLTILQLLGNEDDKDDDELQERFDKMYFEVISIYRKLTKGEYTRSTSSSNIRLPKIALPSFSGSNIKKWPEYIDVFNTLIHNSGALSDTEKFHYLISSLTGDALSVVKAYPVSHEYYPDAYQSLVARYKCKRTLAFTCWKDLLNINFNPKNPREFQKSLDYLEENLSILRSINLPIDSWDFVLVYHLLSKLDKDIRRDFEERYANIELPSYLQLKDFLRSECEALLRDTHFTESINLSSNKSVSRRGSASHALVAATDKPDKRAQQSQQKNSNTTGNFVSKCSFCNESHSISNCQTFLNKSLDDRMNIVKQKNWCYNCLKPSHQLKDCKSIFSCRTCKRKHHTLLHRDHTYSELTPIESSLVSRTKSNTTVLLATAIVQIQDASGKMQSFRALFDTGSQSNFITESAVNRLKLKRAPATANVSGLGGAAAPILGDVTCTVGTDDRVLFKSNMLIISRICGDQPIAQLNTSGWSHIKSLPLADPGFDIPGPIDILLAADVFADSVLNQHIKGGVNQPTAFNSRFGWLLLGKTCLTTSTLLNSLPEIDHELNSLVQRFWELDSLPSSSSMSPEELLCEQKFVSEHFRDSTGRYVVRIPFKEESEPIFEGSRDVALRRFRAIERRLSRDPDLYAQYADFMSDYIESGHMTQVPANEIGKGKYYIPHHCVLRPDSATTRLRVVFDASAKDLNSRSLNDAQHTGPKLQPSIMSILLRFREHNVVFMSDVRQMYRQILVAPEHCDYQRIFWRTSPQENLHEYLLRTITYGLSSSPYLACRILRQLAEDEGDAYPIAKEIILSDIYIDDVTTGFASLKLAQQAKIQLIALFNLGCFKLRKWASNTPELLADLPPEDCLNGSVSLDNTETPTLKVLGLKWDPVSDAFLFEIKPTDRPCTKRSILSEVARIFDPLGFLSPITIQAKCLIQKLWILGIGWDQTPPDEVIRTWNTYRNELSTLTRLRIPRQLISQNVKSCELHGFSDSSEIALGSVFYLRVTDSLDNVRVYFVCSKARVAPLKRTSLPRLELCAAVLLSELYKFIRDTYLSRIKIDAVYLWSDSAVVLAWLRSHSSRWATFVANRVSIIQELTPIDCWHHVASGDNPADVCSRGQFPQELLHNSLWWAGPCWLSQVRETWPLGTSNISNEDEVIVCTEARKAITLMTSEPDIAEPNVFDDLLNRFSSLQSIVNIVAYSRRFVTNCRNRSQVKVNKYLTNVERRMALMLVVKHVQSQSFSEELKSLSSNKSVSKPFRRLNPFVDESGILRVGGRISRSGLGYEQKHPAFLPSDHPLTYLIIDSIHRDYLHPGINTTHFLLLQQFWIVSAKRTIRRQLAKCIKCFRTNPQPLQPFMSDLPSYRVNQIKPFSIVGVDFGGPFRIKLGPHRGAKIDKAYLCLFVCLATKAVHLEVVSTLSTDGFIAALRRFIARRGRCNEIHADCGTNFVGAKNQLASLMQQASSAEKIEFKFNPPSAPHFGGVWEIQIKAAKSHLYRVVGDQVLTFEELSTLFAQIEAVLNSRPLCPISSDPNDLSALTPGHFLTLEPLTAVPDEDHSNINLNRLRRWQLLQAFQQNFWSRWKHEYLNTLTQRAKWTKDSNPLQIGSMVIIKDDNRAPLQWPLARVLDLIKSSDGIPRIAVVKTGDNHIVKRPLVKLCPLPIGA